ncbi:delta(7)-sterol-C5(6)-desaturase-like [Nymphaea colorata]|nr:delta(7)-sterol-C5(6)-desaturase-like [Nymphaea colorata]
MEEAYLRQFVRMTESWNDVVLGDYAWRAALPHFAQSWLRNFITATLLLLIPSTIWCFYIYHLKPHVYFPNGRMPTKRVMLKQVWVSMKALPLFTLLPAVAEYVIEKGCTKTFVRVEEVGWPMHILYTTLYLFIAEFGLYWTHRLMHDVRPLYKCFHATHHEFNKEDTISPFAGYAFDPIDGIVQAAPQALALFVVPMHFVTHELLFVCKGVLAANAHDCIHGKVWPVMGGGYHKIHHTKSRYNYGGYTILMDWLFGTLYEPEQEEEKVI